MSELGYNLRLVGKSLRRDRWFTIVMVVSQALGVSLFVTALTTVRRYSDMTGQVQPDVFRVEGGHDTLLRALYRRTQFEGFAEFSAMFLNLPTANALTATGIATESAVTFISVMAGGPAEQPPRRLPARFADADLFKLFRVDFRYGGPWRGTDERGATPGRVVVLTDIVNQQLYDGADSVGRTLRIGGQDFRVVGVTRQPPGKLNLWDFGISPENIGYVIVPMALADELRPVPTMLWPPQIPGGGWSATSRSQTAFVEHWVRLPTPDAQTRFRAAMAAQDPRASLMPADGVVARHRHAPPPYRIFLIFTLVLLEASVINMMRMLLAKASARAAEIGIHRALGAGRGTIFGRQLCEGVMVSLAGSLLGLALAIPTVATFDRLIPDSPVKLALTPAVVATTLLVCAAGRAGEWHLPGLARRLRAPHPLPRARSDGAWAPPPLDAPPQGSVLAAGAGGGVRLRDPGAHADQRPLLPADCTSATPASPTTRWWWSTQRFLHPHDIEVARQQQRSELAALAQLDGVTAGSGPRRAAAPDSVGVPDGLKTPTTAGSLPSGRCVPPAAWSPTLGLRLVAGRGLHQMHEVDPHVGGDVTLLW